MTTTGPLIDHARKALHLLPRLHRWATASVQTHRVRSDLSLRQLGALFLIREGMSSPGALARRAHVTPAVVTGLLDRLERRGYVRREDEPADRRRIRVVLTDAGLAASREVEGALAESLAAQLATASRAELGALGVALELLERTLGALEGSVQGAWDEGGAEDDEDVDGVEEVQGEPPVGRRKRAAETRGPRASRRRRAGVAR